MKTLKRLLILLFISFVIVTMFNYTKADSSDLYLNELNFNVQINSDGSIDVEEMWNIDIENTNTLFKTFKIDKGKYTRITNGRVSKINKSGTEVELKNINQYYYHVPTGYYYFLNRGDEYEVAWNVGYDDSSGTEKYKISYHVEDAIAIYQDCSEMYWQFLGSSFEIPAKKITGTIKLPKEAINLEDIRVWGHTPDLNGTIYKTANDKVEFTVNDNRARKMVEVRIAMPENMVDFSGRIYNTNKLENIIQEETQWATAANNNRIVKIAIIAVICLLIFAVLIFLLIKNLLLIKRTKQVIPTQHYEYFRDLPREDCTPAEALYILENKYSDFNSYEIGAVFSATLLNLSLKKAIKIEEITNEKGKEDTQIFIICDNIMNITSKRDEILIFEFIKTACKSKMNKGTNTDNNSITMQELKKYIQRYNSKVVTLKAELDKYMRTNLLSTKMLDPEGIKKRNKMFLTGFFSTFATFFLFFFVSVANVDLITTTMDSIGIHWYVIIAVIALIIANIVVENKAKNKISVYTKKRYR